MPVFGDLATMPLTDLLQWASSTRQSGVLEVERGGRVRKIEVRGGSIAACWSDDPGARLGQFLLGRGRINEAQLREALARHEATGRSLGLALLDLGFLGQAELKKAITVKAEETIQGLFEWDDARFRFDCGATLNVDRIDLELRIPGLLLVGVQRQDELKLIRTRFSSSSIVLERTERVPPAEVVEHPALRRIFEHIDGTRCIGELLLHARASEFAVLKLLEKLHELDLVRITDRRSVAPGGPRTLLDPLPPDRVDSPPARPDPERASPRAGADPGRDLLVELEVARRLIGRGEHTPAVELLQASLRAHPGNECVRSLLAEAETAAIFELRSSVSCDAIPVVLELPDPAPELNAEESFLLSLIDGSSDVRSLTWVTPLREVDLLRSLRKLADRGVIELRRRPAA